MLKRKKGNVIQLTPVLDIIKWLTVEVIQEKENWGGVLLKKEEKSDIINMLSFRFGKLPSFLPVNKTSPPDLGSFQS